MEHPGLTRRAALALAAANMLTSPAAAHAQTDTAFPPPDRELRVPVRGGTLYARINGPLGGAATPLLYVHGGPGSAHAHALPLLPLARDRAVILYDQLDCGLSDKPGDAANWTVERFVSEVDAVRAAFGLDRLHLVGQSWGGTIAVEYAARRPAGLASVIIKSPLVSTRAWLADAVALEATLGPASRAAIAHGERTRDYGPAYQAAIADWNRHFYEREPANPAVAAYIAARGVGFGQQCYEAMWGPSEFSCTGTLRNYDGEPLLPRIAAPALFVAGEHDEVCVATLRRFAARVPGARVRIVPGAGHDTLNDRPAEYLAVLRPWLTEHDRARA